MKEMFKYYLEGALHPFLVHERYYQFRHKPISLLESEEDKDNNDYFEKGVNFATLILLSWPFIIFEAFYRIGGFHLSEWLVDNFLGDGELATYFIRAQSTLNFQIFIILLKVVSFPIIAWIMVKIWEAIITFFHHFLGKDDGDLPGIAQTVNNTLTSHVFLLIPLFGPLLKWLSMLIQMYGGLRYNLRYSRLQATIVLLSPFILLAFFIFCGFFFITFFISKLFFGLFDVL
ncbi:MAG: hypothetical protein HYV97_08930 [Bdellovibrio sp.]|nr:hypothetical protein [Bdellovibrio sp.]